MTSTSRSQHRLVRPLAVLLSAVFMIAFAATPAHAAYGPPQTVYFQLQAQNSTTGVIYYVGRAAGTIRFDDGNSSYHLSLAICRQSSYSPPVLRVSVNGTPHQHLFGDTAGPLPECDNRIGGVVNRSFTYNGVIQNVTLRFEGIFFESYDKVKTVIKSSTYDNPFN